jgi:hypothetical protein
MPRKNFTQDLAHPQPGAVLNSFGATEQHATPLAAYFPQARGNFAQGGRWRDKYDEARVGAVAQLMRNID